MGAWIWMYTIAVLRKPEYTTRGGVANPIVCADGERSDIICLWYMSGLLRALVTM